MPRSQKAQNLRLRKSQLPSLLQCQLQPLQKQRLPSPNTQYQYFLIPSRLQSLSHQLIVKPNSTTPIRDSLSSGQEQCAPKLPVASDSTNGTGNLCYIQKIVCCQWLMAKQQRSWILARDEEASWRCDLQDLKRILTSQDSTSCSSSEENYAWTKNSSTGILEIPI